MKITFLGTRANITIASRAHRRHSALLVETNRGRVMFDCGADWEKRVFAIAPDAIVLTHAHPDHAAGLRLGAPCPVHATAASWRALGHFPIERRRTIAPARRTALCGLRILAFPVVHSLLAPAVAYRIEAAHAAFLYCPDVVSIPEADAAMRGLSLYVGDGSSTTRPLVRRRDKSLFGHTTIRAQIGWCADAGVPEAIFTHCGKDIVGADGRVAAARVRALGLDKGVAASIATDGLELRL